MKRTLIILIVIAGVILFLGQAVLFRNPDYPKGLQQSGLPLISPSSHIETVAVPASIPAVGALDSVIAKNGKIARNSSFYIAMRKMGVTPQEIDRMVRSSKRIFNLKQVRSGQTFTLFASASGDVDSLHYVIDRDRILKLRQREDRYTACIDTMPYRITYQLTSGTIRQSLHASLQSEGADPELAGSLALIFGWVIDFFKDIREGDTFTILYEKKIFEDGRSSVGHVLAAQVVIQGNPYYAFRYRTKNGLYGFYDLEGQSLQKTLLRAPLKFTRITSSFRTKRYHPVKHHYSPHLGVDYAAPYGTPVRSTGDGVVIAATHNSANGNYVKIRHNRSYTTYYLHLSRFGKGIRKGKQVRQGNIIGYVGSTGLATGPHLDYRIKVNGRFVNPRTIKLPSKEPVPPDEILHFEQVKYACLSRFMEIVRDSECKTILVEKPLAPRAGQIQCLF